MNIVKPNDEDKAKILQLLSQLLREKELFWIHVHEPEDLLYEFEYIDLTDFLEENLPNQCLEVYFNDENNEKFMSDIIQIVIELSNLEEGYEFYHSDDFEDNRQIVFKRELDVYCNTCKKWNDWKKSPSCYTLSSPKHPRYHNVDIKWRSSSL